MGTRVQRVTAVVVLWAMAAAGCTRATSVRQIQGRDTGPGRALEAPEPGDPGSTRSAAGPGGATGAGTHHAAAGSKIPASITGSKTTVPTAPKPTGRPIRIGAVGTTSGIGKTQEGTHRAVQAWAKWMNDRGGLFGHPVEVITADDGGDAARLKANLRELVEQDHVIAFVGALTVFSLSDGAVRYLEEKRVPMVGGDRLGAPWMTSPMLFPQASAAEGAYAIHMINVARVAGRGAPVGWVVCQEAQGCRDADTVFQHWAPKLGLDDRYHGQATLTQPNYTEHCVQAQRNGVEWLIVGLDASGVRRLAENCAKQGYHPHYAFAQTSEGQASQVSLEGSMFASATFPWLSDANPAMHEFQEVIRRYQPTLALSAHASSGWVAAKLFERAAARIGSEPTSAQVLEGLWAIHNDTLDGLTAPLTFERNKPAPLHFCYFPMSIRQHRWHADATTITCYEDGQ